MDFKIPGVAREGLGVIFASGALCVVCAFLGFSFLFFVFLATTAFVVYFFRDPERNTPETTSGAVISPADGKVIEISKTFEENYLKRDARRISIFLSIFDCHINRYPVSGKVVGITYCPGEFKMAFKPDSRDANERLVTLIELPDGTRVVMIQVAGFLARRIVSRAKFGDETRIGEKFGMIKFGSRVDLYLPESAEVDTQVGQKVTGGETVIARLN